MTRKTIDYTRLGVEACEAFTEGPAAFHDFVRTILSHCGPAACASNGNARARTAQFVHPAV